MTDHLPAKIEALEVPSGLEEFPVPKVSADATLTLPADIYTPWFRSIQVWLQKAGAKNGVDYRAAVSTGGYENGKPLWRVHWSAMTEKGTLYLNLMAASFRMLEKQAEEAKLLKNEQKQIEKA